jgi:uncharacterized protein (TIGR02391 family)
VALPPIDEAHLEQICNVLADTTTGLSGSEITKLLQRLDIADPNSSASKRTRLYDALSPRQRRDACANNVIALIQEAMNPVRFHSDPGHFAAKRDELNTVLAFCGYSLGEDGRISQKAKATTLTEAEERAKRLQRRLSERGVHSDVLTFCRAELVQENYFHAVFEATKSVADKLRAMTGLTSDGTKLVEKSLAGQTPMLAINTLQTETERSEQSGFVNLLEGMFGTFRNVTAHVPKIKWPISEEDALDLLSLASYLHRRLDKAARTNWPRNPSSP